MTLAESQDARRAPECARDAEVGGGESPQAANWVIKAVEACQPSARGCLIGLFTCLGSRLVAGRLVSVAQVVAGARSTKIASFGVGSNPTSWASRGSRDGGDAAHGAS